MIPRVTQKLLPKCAMLLPAISTGVAGRRDIQKNAMPARPQCLGSLQRILLEQMARSLVQYLAPPVAASADTGGGTTELLVLLRASGACPSKVSRATVLAHKLAIVSAARLFNFQTLLARLAMHDCV